MLQLKTCEGMEVICLREVMLLHWLLNNYRQCIQECIVMIEGVQMMSVHGKGSQLSANVKI